MSGIELFKQGGFIMYPLFIFSILAWSIGTYKVIGLWLFSKEFKKVTAGVSASISANKLDEINSVVKDVNPYLKGTHEILATKVSKEVMNERIGRRLAESHAQLKQWIWILGSISASAPFIGLFGTVVGIMDSFKAIGVSGKSGFSVVAAGISESLVATAAGIIVAVVALLFYNYLQSRINSLAQEMRLKLEEQIDLLTARG